MEITEIKTHIKNNNFNHFYIFAGDEWKVQRLYIEQIAKVSGKELRYIDSITDIYGKRNAKMFVPKSYVYVVRDDKDIIQNEKVQEQLDSIIGNNILILLLTTVDKRLKFYKTYKDTIATFEALKPVILKQYIQRQIDLSDKNCEKLMEVCEHDYGRCLLEIDKIKQYVEGYYNKEMSADCIEYATGMKVLRITEDKAFEQLLKNGLIYQPPKDAIFDFVDAILDNNVNLYFELYNNCVSVGEATMVMISVLYNNAKAVLQVQSCKSNDVAKATGLTSWQINNARKHVGKRRIAELLHIIKVCQKCQQAIVTGTMDEEYIMEYILTEVA